jgi:hypothetical protein
MTKLLLVLFLFSAVSRGADLQATRDAAHIGAAFAVHTVVYGFAKKTLGFEGIEALAFSSLITATGTTLFEVLDVKGPGDSINARGIGANLLGIGLSVGATLVFDF